MWRECGQTCPLRAYAWLAPVLAVCESAPAAKRVAEPYGVSRPGTGTGEPCGSPTRPAIGVPCVPTKKPRQCAASLACAFPGCYPRPSLSRRQMNHSSGRTQGQAPRFNFLSKPYHFLKLRLDDYAPRERRLSQVLMRSYPTSPAPTASTSLDDTVRALPR